MSNSQFQLDYNGVRQFDSENDCMRADTRCKNRVYGKRNNDPFVNYPACIKNSQDRWVQTCTLDALRVNDNDDAETIVTDFQGSHNQVNWLAFKGVMCSDNSYWKACGGSGISTRLWLLMILVLSIVIYNMTRKKTKKKYNKD